MTPSRSLVADAVAAIESFIGRGHIDEAPFHAARSELGVSFPLRRSVRLLPVVTRPPRSL